MKLKDFVGANGETVVIEVHESTGEFYAYVGDKKTAPTQYLHSKSLLSLQKAINGTLRRASRPIEYKVYARNGKDVEQLTITGIAENDRWYTVKRGDGTAKRGDGKFDVISIECNFINPSESEISELNGMRETEQNFDRRRIQIYNGSKVNPYSLFETIRSLVNVIDEEAEAEEARRAIEKMDKSKAKAKKGAKSKKSEANKS